jgi:hypothetical protein
MHQSTSLAYNVETMPVSGCCAPRGKKERLRACRNLLFSEHHSRTPCAAELFLEKMLRHSLHISVARHPSSEIDGLPELVSLTEIDRDMKALDTYLDRTLIALRIGDHAIDHADQAMNVLVKQSHDRSSVAKVRIGKSSRFRGFDHDTHLRMTTRWPWILYSWFSAVRSRPVNLRLNVSH